RRDHADIAWHSLRVSRRGLRRFGAVSGAALSRRHQRAAVGAGDDARLARARPGGRVSRSYDRMIALLANPEQTGHRAEGHPERPERVTAILEAIATELGLTAEPAP